MMSFATEIKNSIWSRLDQDCDIDELIYGNDHSREPQQEDNASER